MILPPPPRVLPTHLTTERLRLRPLGPADAEAVRVLWTERDPRVPPHRQIDADGRPTLDDIRAGMAAQLEESARTGMRLLAIERADEPGCIGYCGLIVGSGTPEEPELAYELARAHHGRGFATEAACAVVEAARDAGWTRLLATVRAWNAPSFRVLARVGFMDSGRRTPDPVHGDTLWMTSGLRPA